MGITCTSVRVPLPQVFGNLSLTYLGYTLEVKNQKSSKTNYDFWGLQVFVVITVALFPAKSNNEVLVIGGSESLTADCRQVSLICI